MIIESMEVFIYFLLTRSIFELLQYVGMHPALAYHKYISNDFPMLEKGCSDPQPAIATKQYYKCG